MNAPHTRSASLWRHPVAVAGACGHFDGRVHSRL